MKFRIRMLLAALVALFGVIAYTAPSSAMTVGTRPAIQTIAKSPSATTPVYYYRVYRRHYYRHYYRPRYYYYRPRHYYHHYYYRPRYYYHYGY